MTPPTAAPPTVPSVLPPLMAEPAAPPNAAPPTVPSVSFVVPQAVRPNASAIAIRYLFIETPFGKSPPKCRKPHARLRGLSKRAVEVVCVGAHDFDLREFADFQIVRLSATPGMTCGRVQLGARMTTNVDDAVDLRRI